MSLVAENLSISRGEQSLLSNLSFELHEGQGIWLRGPNGVGKSTLLETLLGVIKPTAGRVLWKGETLHDALDDFHGDLRYIGHKNGNSLQLSAYDALRFHASLLSAPNSQANAALHALGLENRKDVLVSQLSAGQQRRLALARLKLGHAPVWILDEPTVSLDIEGAQLLADLAKSHIESGGAVIFTSHIDLGLDATILDVTPAAKSDVHNDNVFLSDEWTGIS